MLTNHLSTPLEHLQTLISECEQFQSLCGLADATEAIERIHFYEAEDQSFGENPDQQRKLFPRSIIALNDYSGTGQPQTRKSEIQILVRFEKSIFECDRTNSIGKRYIAWLKECENILDQLWGLAASGTVDGIMLNITSINLSIAPQKRTDNASLQDRFFFDGISIEVWGCEFEIGLST